MVVGRQTLYFFSVVDKTLQFVNQKGKGGRGFCQGDFRPCMSDAF